MKGGIKLYFSGKLKIFLLNCKDNVFLIGNFIKIRSILSFRKGGETWRKVFFQDLFR